MQLASARYALYQKWEEDRDIGYFHLKLHFFWSGGSSCLQRVRAKRLQGLFPCSRYAYDRSALDGAVDTGRGTKHLRNLSHGRR